MAKTKTPPLKRPRRYQTAEEFIDAAGMGPASEPAAPEISRIIESKNASKKENNPPTSAAPLAGGRKKAVSFYFEPEMILLLERARGQLLHHTGLPLGDLSKSDIVAAALTHFLEDLDEKGPNALAVRFLTRPMKK